ncbi:MAG: site-2 protease family protein [Corynebacterium sp.]|nr:site-2 protease family protein [Corynebacterium sp.]
MTYLAGVLAFAFGIAVTIALHELGHYGTARLTGMWVRRYFIGFGPTLASVRRGRTEYGLKAVPLGGFCDIAGMTALDPMTPEERPHAMYDKAWWKRILVLSGGIIMNVLIGMSIIYGMALTSGLPNPDADYRPVVGSMQCVSTTGDGACTGPGPAAEAGMEVGDIILSVNGAPTQTFTDVRDRIQPLAGQTATVTVDRAGREITLAVPVTAVPTPSGDVGAVGITSQPITNAVATYNPLTAIPATIRFTGNVFGATWDGLRAFPGKVPGVVAAIFGAQRDQASPMSVVGASRVGGELAERNLWAMFWLLLANLNFFLALFNLVPLPPLDGGHIIIVVYEMVRNGLRRLRGLEPAGPANYRKLLPVTYAATVVLVAIGSLVLIADVVNPVRLF